MNSKPILSALILLAASMFSEADAQTGQCINFHELRKLTRSAVAQYSNFSSGQQSEQGPLSHLNNYSFKKYSAHSLIRQPISGFECDFSVMYASFGTYSITCNTKGKKAELTKLQNNLVSCARNAGLERKFPDKMEFWRYENGQDKTGLLKLMVIEPTLSVSGDLTPYLSLVVEVADGPHIDRRK